MPVTVVLCAMPSELRPVVRGLRLRRAPDGTFAGRCGDADVRATTIGVGPEMARAATARALSAGDVDRVLMVGIAGRIDPALPLGTVLSPEVVVDGASGREHRPPAWAPVTCAGRLATFGDFDAEIAAIPRLRAEGVVAVDMETAAVAAVCEEVGVPWAVFRAVSDDATDGSVDAATAGMLRPDGSPDVGAALRYVVRRPWRIPTLAKLAVGSERAARAAAKAAIAALSG